MAVQKLNVNPTRMELRKLKDRRKTAVRGHKLLKDKSDEMVRRFIELAKENKRLREEIQEDLGKALQSFLLAKAISDDYVIQEAIAMPTASLEIEISTKNIMNVNVPDMVIKETKGGYPYAFSGVTGELDASIETLSALAKQLVKLAEVEKSCNMLAIEIEKNRRRVNALEYFMIPQIEMTEKYITMKLDENERGNIVRLMKVKDIIADKE